MKKFIVLCLLVFGSVQSFAQEADLDLLQSKRARISIDILKSAFKLQDIMPNFSKNFILTGNEYALFHHRSKIDNKTALMFNASDNYEKIISINKNSLRVIKPNYTTDSAAGLNMVLTANHKRVLEQAEIGDVVSVNIYFNYINQIVDNYSTCGGIYKFGQQMLKVTPHVEAVFPGGAKGFDNYFSKNVLEKTSEEDGGSAADKAELAFTVDENGQVGNIRLLKSSKDAKIDQLILEASKNMPKWAPARNIKEEKIKQYFVVSFTRQGC
jgi:TonB family protein